MAIPAFDEPAFLELLGKLVGEAQHLQNGLALDATEDRAGRHVLDALAPFAEEAGGPLLVRHISYLPGRGNIVVTYPGQSEDCVRCGACRKRSQRFAAISSRAKPTLAATSSPS